MRLTQAVFAKFADLMKDDTVAMIGGCFDTIRVPAFPCPVPLCIVARIRLDQGECGVEHIFQLGRILGPEGSEEMPPSPSIPFTLTLEPDATYATFTCITMAYGLVFTAPGIYRFFFMVDDVEIGGVELEVRPPLQLPSEPR
jgi:hypothetical protein